MKEQGGDEGSKCNTIIMVHVLLFKMVIACKGLRAIGLTLRWNLCCLKADMVKTARLHRNQVEMRLKTRQLLVLERLCLPGSEVLAQDP